MNLANGLDAPNEGAWGYVIDDAHIEAIARDGFDTIRLPVRFQAGFIEGQLDPKLLARVDHIIRVALANGLKVILDFHHFREIMVNPERHEDTFVEIWSQLAAHYQGWSNDLMFELLNEPQNALTTKKADALFDRVIPIIRKTHPDRWIIVGGGSWSHIDTIDQLAPRDGRTAITFHYYSPFDFTHQGAEWVDSPPPERGPMTRAEAQGITAEFAGIKGFPAPLFLGEFGVYNSVATEDRAPWMEVVRKASEDVGVPWCHWGYASGFRLVKDDLEWLPGLKDALFAD